MGRTLETTDRTLTIAGVMPPGFRFPDGRVRIWRALDYERLVNPRVMTFVGRLARPVTLTEAGALLEARLPDGVSAGFGTGEAVLVPICGPVAEQRATTVRILLGAGLCLPAPSPVSSWRVDCGGPAHRQCACPLAPRRHRWYASPSSKAHALPASRAGWPWDSPRLVRRCWHRSCLTRSRSAVSIPSISHQSRPAYLRIPHGDWRWRLAARIAARGDLAAQPNVLSVLKSVGQGVTLSRAGSWLRRGITTAEVALAVMLLVGGLLYLRTYAALLAVETGLDTRGVVSLGITFPLETLSPVHRRYLPDRLVDRLVDLPDVVSAALVPGGAPPGRAYAALAAVQI